MNDPSVQCEDILHSFISLVNSSNTITNTTESSDNNNSNCCSSVCNTRSTSNNTTNATTSLNIEVTANTTKTTTAATTTASVLSYLLRSTLNETKSPVFVENSTVDNAQITARIFSATCFINRFINLPQKRSSCSLQNDSNDSDGNNNIYNQMINPGECLIQLIVHQLHFSPNTLALSSNKSFQEQQPNYHQPYSTIRSGNPSSSSFPMNAAVTSTLQSIMPVSSTSSSTTLYHSAIINNNPSTSLPSLSTMCPSSVIWAQYFAILLDYANYGNQECCYLLKLHVPEILIKCVDVFVLIFFQ